VIGLTNDNAIRTPPVYKNSYTVCGQYDGKVTAKQNVTVTCAPSSQRFRYIIVHGSQTKARQALCLAEVAVYGKSK